MKERFSRFPLPLPLQSRSMGELVVNELPCGGSEEFCGPNNEPQCSIVDEAGSHLGRRLWKDAHICPQTRTHRTAPPPAGSGGHTTEMFYALGTLQWDKFRPVYVVAATDQGPATPTRVLAMSCDLSLLKPVDILADSSKPGKPGTPLGSFFKLQGLPRLILIMDPNYVQCPN